MSPLKHVLVATDLSTSARNAAERAALLSQAQHAALDLLYVANPAPYERLKQVVVPDDNLLNRVLESAGENLRAVAAMLFHRYAISAGTQVAPGSVATEITRVVQDWWSNRPRARRTAACWCRLIFRLRRCVPSSWQKPWPRRPKSF